MAAGVGPDDGPADGGYPDARHGQRSRPQSAPRSERPPSAPTRPSVRLQRLSPVHAASPGSPDAQLLSVVEALLRARAEPGEERPAADLTTVEGVCRALRSEPSLAWAAPHAAECFRLLRERAARGGHQGARPRKASARRAQALAGRLCGSAGRLPPMGGGGPGCAVMLARSSSESKVAMSHATASKLAGVDEAVAPALAERVQRLARERPGVGAWLLVETCRDCASHNTTFRHEEKQYTSRYNRLKKQLEASFPVELAVDILVPRQGAGEPAACCGGWHRGPPPVRIGAFEVYLCCAEPLVPFSAVPLPAVPLPPRGRREGPEGEEEEEEDEDEGEEERPPAFSAICVSSKLQSLTWPVLEDMMRRLVKAMPRVPLRVTVRTGAGLPVPGVELEAMPVDPFAGPDDLESEIVEFYASVAVSGRTDGRGKCKILVPFCVPLRLRASHDLLMAPQEREVVVRTTTAGEAFVTETVLQLWESEEAKELVVYCTSPRESMEPPGPHCRPFRGRLLGSSAGELRPNPDGFIRGDHCLLDEVSSVACSGWRTGSFTAAPDKLQGGGQPTEVARLGAPLVKVSLVSACCIGGMSCAHVWIDEEDFGQTGSMGSPVVCNIKCGEHALEVRHTLVPEGLQSPLTVSSSAPCGVQVRLSPQRLRFVCVRTASATDLWIVGGRVAEWRRSPGGPPSSAEVWLWDGELRGPLASGGGDGLFSVKAGVLRGAIGGAAAAGCCLSQALAVPESAAGSKWQVAWHPRLPGDRCVMGLVAGTAEGAPPSRWLARLADESEALTAEAAEGPDAAPRQHLSLRLRTVCCCTGLGAARVTAHGDTELSIDAGGFAELPCGRDTETGVIPIRVDGVPPSLLPGNASEFVVHEGYFESLCVPLDVSCNFWVYWVPPYEYDDDLEAEEPQPYPNGLLWVAADADHVPDEALPVSGAVVCPGAATSRLALDGKSMGPFDLRPEASPEGEAPAQCLIAGLAFEVAPIPGFDFQATEPSPLQERCSQLGGCEIQRLFRCPASVGTFTPLPPPRPYQLTVRTACCGRTLADAPVAIDGAPLRPSEGRAGCFRLPRRRLGDGSGSMQVRVENVLPCLLPGGAREHTAHYGPSESKCLEVGVACMLWVYWVPPEEEEEEDGAGLEAEEELPPEGLLWVACSEDQVPVEARPVTGVLECPGAATEEIELDGSSMGPFALCPAQKLKGLEEAEASPCLLSSLTFKMKAPEGLLAEGFTFVPRDPSPLAERCSELGGCELQRLMSCPVAVGTFRANPLPPLQLALRTSCCARSFAGACVAVNGKDARPFDESGCVEVVRRRKGGRLNLAFDAVPPFMLPGGRRETCADYGPMEPKTIEFDASCKVWVYWVPPVDEESDAEDEEVFADGFLWLACDGEHIPDEGLPVKGVLACPGAAIEEMVLDGQSMGPFTLQRAASAAEGAPKCLLSGLAFDVTAPPGYYFHAKEPSPLAERCEELGGCETQRLLQCPVVVGTLKSLPPVHPLRFALRSTCCGRGFPDARVAANGRGAARLGDSGCFRLPRRRREEREGELQIDIHEVPSCVLPGGTCRRTAEFGPEEPRCLATDILCSFWVYWVPPEEEELEEGQEEQEEEEGLLPPDGLLWVAVDPAHVPEEARPAKGMLECAGAAEETLVLDGSSMGPFELRLPSAALESDAEDLGSCLLSKLRFHMEPPEMFEFHAREPSPLAERCEELGGCELQRLSQCPTSVGSFRALPLPPLHLHLLTACCRCPFGGATVSVNRKEAVAFDEAGGIEVLRRRKGGQLELSVGGTVPRFLLPGGSSTVVASYTPQEPPSMTFDVQCLVWVYWIPADEEEEEEPDEGGGRQPPPEGTLWIACDAEQVDEEALPIRGVLECPGSVEGRLVLDGTSLGPFKLSARDLHAGSKAPPCLFAGLTVSVTRRDGFAYRAKDPSPLAERVEELGGCELQRLLSCPVVMGFLRPL